MSSSTEERNKRRVLQAVEGEKAMREYRAAEEAARVRTAKLRAAREAHEAKAKTVSKNTPAKPAARKPKPGR